MIFFTTRTILTGQVEAAGYGRSFINRRIWGGGALLTPPPRFFTDPGQLVIIFIDSGPLIALLELRLEASELNKQNLAFFLP